jgi:pimeloyl-ACP methyl ester carboxylesterase
MPAKLNHHSIEPAEGGAERVHLKTDRGDIDALLFRPLSPEAAVLWAGSLGNEDRVSPIARSVSEELMKEGIASLVLRYRNPFELTDSTYDTEAGVLFLQALDIPRVALVGHSFSGAVVISAAPLSDAVVAVVALASQTFGARNADRIAPRPLLLVHGTADTRLDCYCSEQIYSWAKRPKELVLIEGASHGLSEHPEVLLPLLTRWLRDKLMTPTLS